MKILLKQIDKDLFSANFEILENDYVVGYLNLKGHLGTNEVKLMGKLYEKEFSMERQQMSKEKFRPYKIIEENNVVGEVYQAEIKKGFFSYKPYKKCIYKGGEYDSYGVSLKDRSVNSIYFNESQVAQYENSNTVYNDLFNFEIYCNNKDEAFISIVIAIHGYIIAMYNAGEKPIKKVRKFYSNDKKWIDKYNPDWVKNLK